MMNSKSDCVLCRGVADDVELQRIQVWEDPLWRLTVSLDAEILAFSYIYIFGGGVPHLHVHLAPHHPEDALNTQIIRGDFIEETLESGAVR